jgi:hypothetical protein
VSDIKYYREGDTIWGDGKRPSQKCKVSGWYYVISEFRAGGGYTESRKRYEYCGTSEFD